jgi:hypothetical protein
MLAIDSMEFNRARRFLSRVSTPALDLSELDGGRGAYHAVIEQSLSSVHERFGTRTGWRVIAQKSHRELAEQVDQIDNP